MNKITSVCVFSGNEEGNDLSFTSLGEQLGEKIAEKKIRLIFGAGTTGIMNAVSKGVLHQNGIMVGVVPDFMIKKYGMPELDKLIVTKTLSHRKSIMYELGQAYIALPGGIGTLEELIEIISAKNLGLHNRPIVLLGPKTYWKPFTNYIKHLNNQGFLKDAVFSIFFETNCVDECVSYIEKNIAEGNIENWLSNITELDIISGHEHLNRTLSSSCPLLAALNSQENAARCGFDWNTKEEAFEKVIEEINELQQVLFNENQINRRDLEEEYGDVLLALINLARHLKISVHTSIKNVITKFDTRFLLTCQLIEKDGTTMKELGIQNLLSFWNKAKVILSNKQEFQ